MKEDTRRSTYSYRKEKDGSRVLCVPALNKSPYPFKLATVKQQRDKTVVASLEPSIASLPEKQFESFEEAAVILLDFYFNLRPEIMTWVWQNQPDKFWALVPKKWSCTSVQRVRQGKLVAPEEISYGIAAKIIPDYRT